jgi:hypothetical protein
MTNGQPDTVHVMIDLETWGILPGSALRSIGAVTFSPYGDCHTERAFYSNIDRASCEAAGLTIDPETEKWWSGQSFAAQNRLVENCRPLRDVVHDFAIWWQSVNGTYVWSNGANFDEVLWRIAADRVEHGTPWKYWNVRDTRTCWHLARLNPKAIKFEGVQHDAVADARHQAKCVARAYSMLNIGPGKASVTHARSPA